MTRCPHCGMAVQDSATICPQCDRNLHAPVAVTLSDLLPRLQISNVSVVDINMPFGSMVWFMVKWAIAAIPAAVILLLAALPLLLFLAWAGSSN